MDSNIFKLGNVLKHKATDELMVCVGLSSDCPNVVGVKRYNPVIGEYVYYSGVEEEFILKSSS